MINKQQFIESNFINKLLDFFVEKQKIDKFSTLISSIENIFLDFVNIEEVLYYSFSEKNFEFEFYSSTNKDNIEIDLIDTFIESGFITKALNSNQVFFENTNKNQSYGLGKIDSSERIIGLLVFKINSNALDLKVNDIKSIDVMIKIFSSVINEFLYRGRLKQSQQLIDQFVASRTIEIEKKKLSSDEQREMMSLNLLHAIPHEVRTPINQIMGLTNYLDQYYHSKDDMEIDELREIFSDILESGRRLNNLFDNYVFYSNLILLSNDIKKIDELTKKVTFSANSFMNEIIQSIKKNTDREDDFIINILDASLQIDQNHLIKIMQEILSNAIKYSEQGTPIEISTSIHNDKYTISCKDYGIGMDESMIENIGAYMQFDRSNFEQQGVGLGLAIVNKVLALYRGSMNIISEKEKFTEIRVKIPIAKVD